MAVSLDEIRHPLDCTLLTDRVDITAFLNEWITFVDGDVTGLTIENDPRYLLAAPAERQYWLVVVRCAGHVKAVAAARRHAVDFTLRFSVFSLWKSSLRELDLCGSSIVLATDIDQATTIEAIFQTYAGAQANFDWIHLEGVPEAIRCSRT